MSTPSCNICNKYHATHMINPPILRTNNIYPIVYICWRHDNTELVKLRKEFNKYE
jgi:hypothetical protein